MAETSAQIVLTQVVARDRLVEAQAKNALATSGADVARPGFDGLLIRLFGAPLAPLVDAALVLVSAAILRGIRITDWRTPRADAHFGRDLVAGLRFMLRHRLLLAAAPAGRLLVLLTWRHPVIGSVLALPPLDPAPAMQPARERF